MANYGGGAAAPTKPKRKRTRRPSAAPGEPRQSYPTAPKPPRPKGPRYGNRERVKGGTLQRTKQRAKRVGRVKGVDPSDGYTGREARALKRADRRRPAAPEGPSGPRLDPEERSLRREVRADTRLAYGGQERELDYRRQQEQEFSQRSAGYYAQHQQDMAQAQAKQIGFQQGVLAGQNQAVQQAAATDQNANNQLLQQQQASAAQRGATVDPALEQQLQQGVAARQASGVAGTNMLAGQAQAQGAYMVNQSQQAGEQGIQAQQDSEARQRKLSQFAEDLAREKGAFRVKTRAAVQEARHKSALEDAAFGLDVEQERNDQRQAARDDRRQSRDSRSLRRDRRADNLRQGAADRERARHNRETEANARAREQRQRDNANSGGPRKDWTHGDRQDYDTALTKLRQKDKKHHYNPSDRQQVVDALVKSGMTREVARAAWIRFIRSKRARPPSATPRNPDGTPG